MMHISSTECLQQKHAGVSLALRAVAEGMSGRRCRVKRTKRGRKTQYVSADSPHAFCARLGSQPTRASQLQPAGHQNLWLGALQQGYFSQIFFDSHLL